MQRRGDRLLPQLLGSALVHLGVGLVVLLVDRFWPETTTPLLQPEDVIHATAVTRLPKQTTRMPEKATRTPDPPAPEAAPTPAPPPPPTGAPEAPPPPPRSSDMVLQKESAQPKKGAPEAAPAPKDRSADREALLREQRKAALLRDASAAIGPEDRVATDPNGVDPSEATIGSGVGAPMDPALSRYIESIRAAVIPNWTPLPSVVAAHPEYQVVVQVSVSADGSLGPPKVVKSSGDAGFDRSATNALLKTGRIPPPPARYQATAARGVQFVLYAKDKQ